MTELEQLIASAESVLVFDALHPGELSVTEVTLAAGTINEIKCLTSLVNRLKEDGDRLASTYVIEVFPHEWVCRGGCHHWARFGEQIEHSPDCPITLHRALMKELE